MTPEAPWRPASIMIGEKAAEMIAADHGVRLERFVGAAPLAGRV